MSDNTPYTGGDWPSRHAVVCQNNRRRVQHHTQSGFGLAELLVSMLLFAFGVVTMVALQARLQKTAFDNQQRQNAVFNAQELAGRLSLQPDATQDAVGNYSATRCNSSPSSTKRCASEPGRVAQSCTPAEMVSYDIQQVLCSNANSLNNTLIEWTLSIGCQSACAKGVPVQLEMTWLSTGADAIEELRGQSSDGPTESLEYDSLNWEFVP